MIAELTLEHYVYYLRWVEGDRAETIQERRAAFERELRGLLAHLERLSGQCIPAWEWPQESQDRCVSQRIVNSDWLHNSTTARSYLVEARTYGDVYRLQIAYCQRGAAKPEALTSLRDEAWQPAATEHLLGISTYLCGIATDRVDELAARTIKAYTGRASDALVSTHLKDDCAWLYGSPQHPYVAALFYPDEECEAWAGRTFINDAGPRLELYKHKVARQLAWCEENVPLLFEQARSLRDLLGEVGATSPPDLELLQRLARSYRVFSGNVGMLVERQMTIGINLSNLDSVLKELESLAEDRLLVSIRDHLHRRQKQLEADLTSTDKTRQQVDDAIHALRTELEVEHLLDLQQDSDNLAPIGRTGWPGTAPPFESEILPLEPFAEPSRPVFFEAFRRIARFFKTLMMRLKPSRPLAYPQVNSSPLIPLSGWEKNLLRHVYQGFGQVLVEKKFGGGYSGTQVLLTLPITPAEVGGLRAARKVTKLGAAIELRRERDNYAQFVQDFLPFCVAQVEGERYYEQGDWAGLNYKFVGGGALGQVVDLDEYYRKHTDEQVVKTLDNLLDKELGQWYSLAHPLSCFFAAEYGQHIVEHLRLRLRPASSDALWVVGQTPAPANGYRQMGIDSILHEHETIQAGAFLSVEGMVVKRIKHGLIKLEDPASQGTIVRVECAPDNGVVRGLELGSVVGVRGKVVYNRRARMEQIVRAALPDLSPGIGSTHIELPGEPGSYPNPLRMYPEVLGRTLTGQQSYVHGDLHLRNILVDQWGKGWLIDFARVEKRHNLFDFIKLETYVRLMALASSDLDFSLGDYVRFEESLAAATLGEPGIACPDNADLRFAHRVIQAIRNIAGHYIAPNSGFMREYFPALFLYCLAVMKYYREDAPQPTRLAFATAVALGRYL